MQDTEQTIAGVFSSRKRAEINIIEQNERNGIGVQQFTIKEFTLNE